MDGKGLFVSLFLRSVFIQLLTAWIFLPSNIIGAASQMACLQGGGGQCVLNSNTVFAQQLRRIKQGEGEVRYDIDKIFFLDFFVLSL